MARLFSESTEYRRPTDGLVENDIPARVRNGLRAIALNSPLVSWTELLSLTVQRLDLDPGLMSISVQQNRRVQDNRKALDGLLDRGSWVDVLDFCTVLYEYTRQNARSKKDSGELRDSINALFVRNYSAYRMNSVGEMYRPATESAEKAVEQARALLADDRFKGPDRQFQEAVLSFHRAVNPSYENAVAQAVNSMEGVARIALRDENGTLGKLITGMVEDEKIHKNLGATIKNLYWFGSDTSRHGLVGDPAIDRPIAEYVLTQSAAAIVFLARLHGIAAMEHPD